MSVLLIFIIIINIPLSKVFKDILRILNGFGSVDLNKQKNIEAVIKSFPAVVLLLGETASQK